VKTIEEIAGEQRSPEVRRRIRRTAWLIAVVIAFLGVGAACFIAQNGRKSRTVLHSQLSLSGAERRGEGESSWT
jgi:hypothetical protein